MPDADQVPERLPDLVKRGTGRYLQDFIAAFQIERGIIPHSSLVARGVERRKSCPTIALLPVYPHVRYRRTGDFRQQDRTGSIQNREC
jgi:hypothetical protein